MHLMQAARQPHALITRSRTHHTRHARMPHRLAGLPVAAATPALLVKALQRARHVPVHHKPAGWVGGVKWTAPSVRKLAMTTYAQAHCYCKQLKTAIEQDQHPHT